MEHVLETYKGLFSIETFTKIFKKNIDDFIRNESLDPRENELARQIDLYKKRSINGDLKSRELFLNYLKTKLLTNINLFEVENGKLLEDNCIVEDIQFTEEMANWIIPFDDPDKLSVRDKFEILLNKYKDINEQGYDRAFSNLKNKYSYKKSILGENQFLNSWNEYTSEDIERFYKQENIHLEFKEKIDIITQRLYSEIWGLGLIDQLAYSDVNEVGISNNGKYIYVWDQDKIRLSFLQLTEQETKIIQDRATSFDRKKGQLDTNNPEINCDRADQARVTALMNEYSSARVLCVRVFNKKKAAFRDIVKDYKLQILTQVLLKTGQKISLQGEMGVGKTTTMQTFIEILDDSLHIGTIEDYFEQHNRLKYENKRVVELQVTDKKNLLDAAATLFRLSVDVASVGEVREGEALLSFVQLAQALPGSALFTNHVASPEDSIPRWSNLLISTGKYATAKAAVADLVNYINIIYQHEIINGQRVISKVVEVVPLINKSSDVDLNMNMSLEELRKLAYIQQIQENPAYMYRLNPLLEYENGEYRFKNYPSSKLLDKASKNEETANYMKGLLELMREELGD